MQILAHGSGLTSSLQAFLLYESIGLGGLGHFQSALQVVPTVLAADIVRQSSKVLRREEILEVSPQLSTNLLFIGNNEIVDIDTHGKSSLLSVETRQSKTPWIRSIPCEYKSKFFFYIRS